MNPGSDSEITKTLDRLFRRETGRLVALLARRLGPGRLELAEDIAQDALVAAARTWPYQGLPDNPAAWLHRVAMNRMIDRLRRQQTQKLDDGVDPDSHADADDMAGERPGVDDPELQLIFLCCHPRLPEADQLALTLNSALGFAGREVAGLFLLPAPTLSQRLSRVKARIRKDGLTLGWPLPGDLQARLGAVHKVIYLAFSLGYSPGQGDDAVRHDVALEALRLVRSLCTNRLTASPDGHALSALLCFQASRLDTRVDADGRFVRLADQKRADWDRALLSEGFLHLKAAQGADQLSRYHLEAGIAAAHAAAPGWAETDWANICRQYQLLEDMTGCPVVALNHAVAMAMRGEHGTALGKLVALKNEPVLGNHGYFHVARAEILLATGDRAAAAADFRAALTLGGTTAEIGHLQSRLSACL
ncbi:MAG: RNA polymerase subunit sigma [Alphaproteobacteria bacterium]|nr:MAG: RNA polymerase subunit sigma [Alphaproteobacteria bacterium]